ncbi:PIF1-like helicase domain-containing protein [Hirsutella rhossiliensis]|uniref:ATP-dependent DNA helicase n=1 Tax=Hirsutella rhossiliensis TaxID=111463 RepID=A0A9P8MRJ4_9HYPO|nr:PIF1-like helicase domain-containing protein [Hirsutella rhossiliensis]KAH0959767.1 PIF1-like helicase domain-containing protein [Hirsutella rhossiliensis]
MPRRRELQAEEFEAGERLANEQTWCAPVPRERQVRTVRRFYRAFHDAGTLPIATCTLCYRKRAKGREGASPAMHLHGRLGCEHAYPDELKDLTPLEEKLISLNSCYGFVTKYSIPGGQRQSVRYPRHVKGHITVFPNDVQGLAANVLPHPLLRVMDEIHVSWQGAERPGPRDLSGLLSVRRSAVERALAWLKENNPLYGEVEIDTAEMASWGAPPHGVPPVVCERLERNEPSARERTRTAQVVPPSERAMDEGGAAEIEEILAMLRQGRDPAEGSRDVGVTCEDDLHDDRDGARPEEDGGVINEVTSSGMFPLDGAPDVADAEKICFARDAVGPEGARAGPRTWVGTAARGAAGDGGDGEPYIQVRRGDDFADSADASFFAKAFPTLFLWLGRAEGTQAERVAEGLMSTRNMKLQAWADVVLRRHGGRFATHPIFAFLVFNMGVRSRNRQASMLGAARVEAARVELEATGKTSDDGVKELIRSLSVFGYRQPMSRESRLSMRKKILSLIIRHGVPAIWFTLNPNDITNLVKLRLAAHRGRDPDEAEAFLRDLGTAYKRTRLAISDPMSSAIFFHREMTLFFEHYVNVGEESVFGHVGAYYGAVETNERGALHIHGLLWLRGNAGLGEALGGSDTEEQAAYRERIVRYVDSVFSEELDAEGYCAVQAERSATADISSRLDDVARFTDTFDEEANFCAGATQIHTHSATCVKYSLGARARTGDLCRFKAPWRLVERTALTADGVLEIRRTHSMVNRWNRAMAVGLRHNHDISFIATQRKTMALIYYITNYATKGNGSGADRDAGRGGGAEGVATAADPIGGNKTRTFLLKAANRVFTERPLSQVEVIAHLLGYPAEFSSGSAWAYVNANQLYWAVFRRWRHLRRASGAEATGDAPDETALRRPGSGATVCLDGYLSKEFSEGDDESCHRRAAVQHLALFVPWESFLGEEAGDINDIWARARGSSGGRRRTRSATPAVAATAEEGGMTAPQAGDEGRGAAEGGEEAYRAGGAGDAARLIDVVRNAAGAGQVTAQSTELLAMTQQLCRFQQSALGSAAELAATVVAEERAGRRQRSAARERERAIQGIQGGGAAAGVGADRGAALRGVMGGFGEDHMDVTAADGDVDAGTAAGMRLTLNEKQAIALVIVCRQLDRIRQGDEAGGDGSAQLCLFIGGEGGTGKSRVIEALVELLARRDLSSRLLVTATSGTAAARINGITLHSACGLTVGQGGQAGGATRDVDGVRLPGQGERFVDGRSRMDWQEKEVLVIDEVSMLGARTLHAANEQLCRLRGSARDFGGIPVVIFCGDFHQFRPVQERSILLPSAAVAWDEDGAFAAEQRRQHDKAHALWRRFTTVVMLQSDEQMRAAGDPELRRLLGRIRRGEQDRSDLELLNSSATPVPAVFVFVPGMPVVVNQNTHQGLKLVNGAGYTAVDVIPDRAFPGHRVSAELTMHFGPPAGIVLASETTRGFHFVGMPAGTILLTPISVKITAQRKRPWQRNDVSRRGLRAAFACTDYKVQGGTLERVALELRGARMTTVEGRAVPSPCDPYSLYVQLSRCPTLDGIMLVSEVRERDPVGNRVPEEMTAAQARLEELSRQTTREAADWLSG